MCSTFIFQGIDIIQVYHFVSAYLSLDFDPPMNMIKLRIYCSPGWLGIDQLLWMGPFKSINDKFVLNDDV